MPSLTDQVDERLSNFEGQNVPGCSVSIIRDGQIIYKRGYGMANLEERIPYTTNTITSICSIAKQFTSMSIALLEEQGHLSVADNIREYLPELPEHKTPVTIQHLLYHTSGIRDSFQLFLLQGLDEVEAYATEEGVFDQLTKIKELNCIPGDQHIYCNPGYIFLGMILKRVTGQSLSDFVRERIFSPLRMNNTYFVNELPLENKPIATGYFSQGEDAFEPAKPIFDQALGSGGIWSTPEDMYLWDQNFYTNRLGGGQNLIKKLETPGVLNNGEKIRYARGIKISEYRGLKISGHDGSGRGFKSAMLRIPEHKFSVICLTNRSDGDHPWSCCLDIVMYHLREVMDWSAQSKKRVTTKAKRKLEPLSNCEDLPFVLGDFIGKYACEALDATYEIIEIEGDLYLELFDPNRGSLFQSPLLIWKDGENPAGYENDRFQVRHIKMVVDVAFLRNEQGDIEGFTLNTPRIKSLQFCKIKESKNH